MCTVCYKTKGKEEEEEENLFKSDQKGSEIKRRRLLGFLCPSCYLLSIRHPSYENQPGVFSTAPLEQGGGLHNLITIPIFEFHGQSTNGCPY